MIRMWALWRRVQYLFGLGVFLTLIVLLFYYLYGYEVPTCFDNIQNGTERGIDCGGSCTQVCSIDVTPPVVLWSRAFEIVPGQYNAVAYVENRNIGVGSPKMQYTLSLYDAEGLIISKKGTTVLPPDSTYPIFEGRLNTGGRVPIQTIFELDDQNSLWLPASVGREQFVIEERALKDADNEPKLNARITNTALTDMRNVEVVATIFDAKKNALTASMYIIPYIKGRSTESVVFTWPEPIAKTVRSCEVPTDVILAVDLSGSMNDDGGIPPEPITSVLKAASAFVSRLKKDDQVGVVTYATQATTKEVLTRERDRVGKVIKLLTILKADETGSTNTGDAILRAKEEFASSRHNKDARKVLVLLTDGLANDPGETPELYAQDAATALKAAGVEIYTIGLGEKVNEPFLRSIASGDSHYFKAASAGTIDSIYRSVTSAICEDGAAVIDIVPKSEAVFAPLQ